MLVLRGTVGFEEVEIEQMIINGNVEY